jgi:hypothetical protein
LLFLGGWLDFIRVNGGNSHPIKELSGRHTGEHLIPRHSSDTFDQPMCE